MWGPVRFIKERYRRAISRKVPKRLGIWLGKVAIKGALKRAPGNEADRHWEGVQGGPPRHDDK